VIGSEAIARRVCPAPLLVALAVACAGAACGPIGYVSTVTHRASDAVDAARAAGAETLAPYWWTRATQYLAMAREVAAHADFQGANRFGALAAEAADHALADAEAAARDPAKRPAPPAPEVAPAKDEAAAPPARPAPLAPAKGDP